MKRRYNSEESKRKILSACVKLFIEQGYHNTTLAQVLKEAEVSSSTFQNIFHSKDGVLLELTDFMFDNQFTAARGAASNLKPLYIYALETAIQLTLAELNENLRDIYVEAYSVERVTERIYERTSTELYRIFGSYMPECTESDFYEYEIGTAGVMRNYMAKRCNKYFSLEKKLVRFLNINLGIYHVPEAERKEAIDFVLSIDVRGVANDIMQRLFQSLAMRFSFELGK